MKTYILSLVLALAGPVSLSAQTDSATTNGATLGEAKPEPAPTKSEKWSVQKCRAYAQMKVVLLKEGGSLDTLSVPELVAEANQMQTCFADIDNEPFRAGVTFNEALETMMKRLDYLLIAARCRDEALVRLTQWLDRKHLSEEFLQSDANARSKAH